MTHTPPSRSQPDRADQARARILDAATREFSANGLAGARTERIAQAAGVNKALLYYYFRSKDALYAASLEAVAARMAAANMAVLNRDCSPGERLLRTTLNHFDRIYSQHVFQTLLQQEMIRLRKGESNVLSPLIDRLFKPMGDRMLLVAEEGIRSGELVPVDRSQIIYALLGPNVFYFLSAPMMRLIADFAPFDPEALAFRRKVAMEFLGQAIFTDREYGSRIAARVLADTPMPAAESQAHLNSTFNTSEPIHTSESGHGSESGHANESDQFAGADHAPGARHQSGPQPQKSNIEPAEPSADQAADQAANQARHK